MEETTYRDVYDEFMKSYASGTTNAEEVGIVICKMAQFYCNANMNVGQRSKAFSRVFANIMQLEEAGKPISAAKAKIMVESSDESHALDSAKITLENIEQLINGLKYLQRGLQVELSNQY